MAVIQYTDVRFEAPNPAIDTSPTENYDRLARLVIDRQGPEVLSFAEESKIDLLDPVVRWSVLVHVRSQRARRDEEFERLGREARFRP